MCRAQALASVWVWNERETDRNPTRRIWTCHSAPRLRIVAMGNLLL